MFVAVFILITSSENPPSFHWQRCGQINHNIIHHVYHTTVRLEDPHSGDDSHSHGRKQILKAQILGLQSQMSGRGLLRELLPFYLRAKLMSSSCEKELSVYISLSKKAFLCHFRHFSHCSWAEFSTSHFHSTRKPYPHSSKTGISVFSSDVMAVLATTLFSYCPSLPFHMPRKSTPPQNQNKALP